MYIFLAVIDMIELHLYYRFTVYNIPSERKFLVDASIRLCFEAKDHTCLKEYTVLNNADFMYADCNDSVTVPFGGKF